MPSPKVVLVMSTLADAIEGAEQVDRLVARARKLRALSNLIGSIQQLLPPRSAVEREVLRSRIDELLALPELLALVSPRYTEIIRSFRDILGHHSCLACEAACGQSCGECDRCRRAGTMITCADACLRPCGHCDSCTLAEALPHA